MKFLEIIRILGQSSGSGQHQFGNRVEIVIFESVKLSFNLLITDVQFTEDSDEDWEAESDPETESTKHRLDTRSVHAMHLFLSLATGNL